MAQFRFTLNGLPRTVEAEPDTPLIWVLREQLDLTGTKFGCGAGICGSCTVLQNGKAVRSCQLSIAKAAGTRIVTIEGLSKDGNHPLQKAWLEEDVAQCGYCQPAFILSAKALLDEKPNPTDADIREAIGDLVCRCGTYGRIQKAIHRAAKEVRK